MGLIEEFLEKGILLSPKVKAKIKESEVNELLAKFDDKDVVLTERIFSLIKTDNVKVVNEYKKGDEIKRIRNFVDFYNERFEFLRDILKKKLNVEKITSINKLNNGDVTAIGMVKDKKEDGFALEDPTGSVFCISDKKILEDEVVAIKGKFEKKKLHEEKIFYPDIPLSKKVNTTKDNCPVLFTKKLSSHISQKYSYVPYIFTFESEPGISNKQKYGIVIKKGNVEKDNKRLELNLPFVVEAGDIRILVFEMEHMDDIKKKLNIDDEKKVVISLLKRRHLLPFVYMDNDPYLIKKIPDIIFFTGGKESFFLNYKGVSVISVSNEKSFLVNLKTRDFEEVK
ncbi:MAG: hypothetical protein KAT37_02410 [Candidatus Aenigmarchaeota archaeon]|nr:hypothetical protein [Candidatus Aenigmarchaeota archaeon]